jgi:hypothetical protein
MLTKCGEMWLSIAVVNSRDWCCYEVTAGKHHMFLYQYNKVVPHVPFKATNNTNVNGNICTELFVHCTYTLHVVDKIHVSK